MKFEPLELPGVIRVTLDVFRDDRGAFMETWHGQKLDRKSTRLNSSHT